MLEQIAEKGYTVLDGAMGTSLFEKGLVSGDCPEWWNLEHQDRVMEVHQSFVDAGSEVILTNTFGGNRHRLKLHQLETRVEEINRAGTELARKCAGDKALVAGSMGPTGEILEPLGSLSREEAMKAFKEQAAGLAEGGADLLWIETISDLNELSAAIEGAASTGLKIAATMSFDTAGRTMMGVTPADFVSFTKNQPVYAYGANCGVGPEELNRTIGEMKNAGGKNLIAKTNCGVPVFEDGAIRYTATVSSMGHYAVDARNLGANFIGGCCGTSAKHIRKIHQELQGSPYVPRKLEKIPSSEPTGGQRASKRKRRMSA